MPSEPNKGEQLMSDERRAAKKKPSREGDEYLRAPNEDDDGYDPYSDRRPRDPLFEEDPWR